MTLRTRLSDWRGYHRKDEWATWGRDNRRAPLRHSLERTDWLSAKDIRERIEVHCAEPWWNGPDVWQVCDRWSRVVECALPLEEALFVAKRLSETFPSIGPYTVTAWPL